MSKTLILRFSAMGDVAMLVPVVHNVALQHPEAELTVLTRKHLVPLFDWTPDNVRVRGINIKSYEGIGGLNKLYKELKTEGFDAVADVHDVLRTKYLRLRFRLSGVPTAVIDKGRAAKKQLIGHGLTAAPLTPMTTRYAEVFGRLGLSVDLDKPAPCFSTDGESLTAIRHRYGEKKAGEPWIGIAPFAAHPGKIYPPGQMREVAQGLAAAGCRVFLFGAGQTENDTLATWEEPGRIENTCGKLGGLHNEMLLMSELDAMLAMDSANMHIAAIVGTPTYSVWGATHPKAGFVPWMQPESHVIQDTTLDCRPCSIYGNKPCRWKDFRCLANIKPEEILGRIL